MPGFANVPRRCCVFKSKNRKDSDSDSRPSVNYSSGMSSEDEQLMTELDRYLSTPHIKDVEDPLSWWYQNRGTFPRLWRMARDYHTIPGMYSYSGSRISGQWLTAGILASSVAVERVFSKGRLIISHICNRLSAESTCALLCLGVWSKMGYVEHADLKHAASLPDVKEGESWEGEDEDDFEIVA